MRIDILTLFPEMFAPLEHSMIRRGREAGLLDIRVTNIRDYARDKHQTTDERLYGGGAGMVLKPDVLAAATRAVTAAARPRVLVTSPAGRPFDQALGRELAACEQLIIVCGHYEGIDQRFIDAMATDVVSLGDFVLTGGEIPALAIADCVSRLIPGVLGDERAAEEESFSDGLLEYPQYTRPPLFEGREVPAVLQEGDHAKIAAWRRQRSLENTYRFRPELLESAPLSEEDAAFLAGLRRREERPFRLYTALLHYPVYNKKHRVVTTSLTNLDLHDISRAAATYELSGYYLVQPLPGQRELIGQLIGHWQQGFGHKYNPDRETALTLARCVPSLADAVEDISRREGRPPRLIATGAGLSGNLTGYGELRRLMRREGGSYLLLFGTGWGLTDEIKEQAEFRLQPVWGRGGYNHLSVRSAAAIIFDRLLGDCRPDDRPPEECPPNGE
ncbi:MAG: tRNA (guanosine(37)-N1)-methyltransferase TrmD [Firmicutes bacterium]|nr:tRNA (guanosine(37)-N1)-methyltransferase TrmD [Bacillota bacterium]